MVTKLLTIGKGLFGLHQSLTLRHIRSHRPRRSNSDAASPSTGETRSGTAPGGSTQPVNIGRRAYVSEHQWFNGVIDEVAVYSGVLPADRVLAHPAEAARFQA